MNNIYGIVLKNDRKVYYFNGHDLDLSKNTYVVVETEKGLQYGKVCFDIDLDKTNILLEDIKDIVRVATDEDYDNYVRNLASAEKCLRVARDLVRELNLSMNILDASYTLDKKQLLFNFVADDRVDFRNLAKRLASLYKTRIELRQIGARDKARNVSGIGACGRTICCSTFLQRIDSVTMNMAKNQNIALNPSKINGLCGRLLCCLTYEDDEYSKCQRGMPSVGQTVRIDSGTAKVISVDVLNRKYKVDCDGMIKEIVVGCGKCDK